MANQNHKGLKRIVNAFGYSVQGFRACFRHEEAFRQELYATLLLLPLGIWLGASGVERALLVGSLLLVPLTELLNSALEAVVDRFGPELHALSGRAKDIGSAAVFLAIVLAVAVWALVLLPRWL
ncbi:MAG: diacylglycerol kinase [Candidatus Sedimenticola endophacoides]|uniref:Diacylglycerol kinase n=1 Tax=Candidatus Sedimenticola endophacoides TaxID=2548426 RepID=A0A6N4DTH7_9GAMM|nr:MAG: diacylglycerol kinase [Candidatus Sedimenticola endophacoides]OQX37996.1 MAG: diacylglycerol kinase [Candidatus Sedimenticola endophacoides]OQX40283.1 MAG: diacylglycerol kinase [Candidatus Sedimenticola endophacoides]OQX49303.1 MAG: diacylglycerol kinase [Candidatus Sedimenticola endophacoides]PUE00228.1 MAG: diacylglycerol kinase [Candidatus Sedimenticola endophacoides]